MADYACRSGPDGGEDEALIESHLRKVAVDRLGWEALDIDPDDEPLWEHTYPRGEMHGGAPPALRVIDAETARVKYWALSIEH